MNLNILNAFLPHLDPDASLAFYRDLLGFDVRMDVGYENLRWLTVGPPDQPGVAIVLHPPAVDPSVTEAERTTILELMAKGSYGALTLSTTNLDEVFARLEAGNAEIMQEPMDQDWGVRDCAVRDPAGNTIRINQVA